VKLTFTETGGEDYVHWQTADRTMLKRITKLIDAMLQDPFEGIGKPEQLHHSTPGAWSRRITEEHRLVYLVEGDQIVIFQARYHY
jgi:toxin YoeB